MKTAEVTFLVLLVILVGIIGYWRYKICRNEGLSQTYCLAER